MKKVLSILLTILMMLSAVILPASPALAADSGSGSAKNPLYFREEMPSGRLQRKEGLPQKMESRTYKGHTYYTKGESLYKLFKNKFIQRKEFTLYVLRKSPFTDSTFVNYFYDVFMEASEDSRSTSALDGDYMRWAWCNYYFMYNNTRYYNGYYYYRVKLDYVCWDTAAQEKQVDTAINTLVKKIEAMDMSDYEKVKYVHDYLCKRTTYCDAALYADPNDDTYNYVYSPYGALIYGDVVCQGYATAFYRICKELGFSVRVVTSDEGCHAWNLIGLNDSYYYVDVTWDDCNIDGNLGDPYQYFLVNYNHLIVDDQDRYNGFEHLPESFFQTDYYYRNYENKIDNYDYNETNSYLLSNCTVTVSNSRYTYNGYSKKPEVEITDMYGDYVDPAYYTVTYKDNIKTGVAKAIVKGKGTYSGKSFRQFRIKPAKMGKIKLGSRTQYTVTLKWSKAKGNVSGYSIECYDYGFWEPVKTVNSGSTTSAKITGLSPAKKHSFRIRAFKTENKRKIYGAYSSVFRASTKPRTPKIKSLNTKNKAITVKWGKVNATGYQIQVSKSKNFKKIVKKATAGSSATSKKIKNLSRGKKYYVRVRAYKTISGNKIYSSWSKVKSIKCK